MATLPPRGRNLLRLQQGHYSMMPLCDPNFGIAFIQSSISLLFRSEPPLSPKKAPSLPETSDVSIRLPELL